MALVVNVVVLAGIQGSHPTKPRSAVLVVQILVKNEKDFALCLKDIWIVS